MSKSQLQFLPLILLSLHDCIDYTGTAQQVLSEEGGGGGYFFLAPLFLLNYVFLTYLFTAPPSARSLLQ